MFGDGGSCTPYAGVGATGGLSLEDTLILQEGSAIVEMLLEAYFLQLDQTANRLESCQQCIHDTEDTINIKLDQHRNYLIRCV
jgi:magnesium transporter